MQMPRKYQPLTVNLSTEDHHRLKEVADELSKGQEVKRTKAEIAREAIRWYLDHYESRREEEKQSELAKTIETMTERICGMLARQGAEVGTLYELAWQTHVDNKVEQRFVEAANTVKTNMRKRLKEDEQRVAEAMKRVVEKQ